MQAATFNFCQLKLHVAYDPTASPSSVLELFHPCPWFQAQLGGVDAIRTSKALEKSR